MKYRVRLDLLFISPSDAEEFMVLVKPYISKATTINIGTSIKEVSFIHHEICGHDEGKSCTHIEKLESK